MKAVLQRVLNASVDVGGERISSISRGICCLIGIGAEDTLADLEYVANKILSVRAFPESLRVVTQDASVAPRGGGGGKDEMPDKPWACSVRDIGGEVLCVSQFTLFASTRKGAKPDFHAAMGTDASRQMYERFLARLGQLYSPQLIKDGQFGAMMNVQLVNEGPVTFIIDSRELKSSSHGSRASISGLGGVSPQAPHSPSFSRNDSPQHSTSGAPASYSQ